MCGIFGIIGTNVSWSHTERLAKQAERRGRDSSGLVLVSKSDISVFKADSEVGDLFPKVDKSLAYDAIFGHTRLITNGLADNQPVVANNSLIVHNGIIINHAAIFETLEETPSLQIDTEALSKFIEKKLNSKMGLEALCGEILEQFVGTLSVCILLTKAKKLILLSNNGSLYTGKKDGNLYFASEEYSLKALGINDCAQILNFYEIVDFGEAEVLSRPNVKEYKRERINLIPEINFNKLRDGSLETTPDKIKRCTKCILPETMPFIKFDHRGICNYCNNYQSRLDVKNKNSLFSLVEPHRRQGKRDVILPFSGGRDSCYGLHLAVKELGLNPITYTYDWGMVTDLARRNISRMCSKLGVENIIVAADIQKKRANIRKNLIAWLKSPDLGMVSILTAGDKHFFRYVKDIQSETGITLNLWGVNPLEVTHFKAGFLGIPPSFEETKVYNNGYRKQLRYQWLRFKAMCKSPGYFNSSILDTLSGEYYRSIAPKKDYHHIFDYWMWNEELIDNTLINEYDWEISPDTPTTWRIGDGTAGFYNYIYTTVAGFSEHDTFRSNQVREGIITRDQALDYVTRENEPRYPNIKWYLDTLGLEYDEVIHRVNSIPKLYRL